jgi:hypothetical protein
MCSVGAAMGLQLSVRYAADVIIVDLHGKATIGRTNDFLNGKELREQPEMHMKETLLY